MDKKCLDCGSNSWSAKIVTNHIIYLQGSFAKVPTAKLYCCDVCGHWCVEPHEYQRWTLIAEKLTYQEVTTKLLTAMVLLRDCKDHLHDQVAYIHQQVDNFQDPSAWKGIDWQGICLELYGGDAAPLAKLTKFFELKTKPNTTADKYRAWVKYLKSDTKE